MKNFRFFIRTLIFVLSFSALALGQTEKAKTSTEGKIGFINTEAFGDKETGIKELVAAYDKIEAEFKPKFEELNSMAGPIVKENKELVELSSRYAELCKIECDALLFKISEYDLLVKKYKKRQDEVKLLFEKQRSEILEDVNKKIDAALQQFAKERGYAIILDSSKVNSSVISHSERFDITKEFIQFYNENFAKTETQL